MLKDIGDVGLVSPKPAYQLYALVAVITFTHISIVKSPSILSIADQAVVLP